MEAVRFKQNQVSWRASWHLSCPFLKAVLCKLELVQHFYVHEEDRLAVPGRLWRSLYSCPQKPPTCCRTQKQSPCFAPSICRGLLITLCWETTRESEVERLPNEPRNLKNIPSTGETWKEKVTKDQRRLISLSYSQALTKNVSACLSYCVLKIK